MIWQEKTTDKTRLLELFVRLRGFNDVSAYEIGNVIRLRVLDKKFCGHSFEKRKSFIDFALKGWSGRSDDSFELYLFSSLEEDRKRNEEFFLVLDKKL